MDAGNDFQGTLDPIVYLEKCFKSPEDRPLSRFALENLHKFFTTKHFPQEQSTKMLDYGCGPVIANVISAAAFDCEIILAEFTDSSREAIQQWLDHEPSSWNWSPYFNHVVQTLEGKDGEETLKREENLRKAIKGVVPCDITRDPPIAEGFEGPYNVVMSILCIENGCLTRDEYKAAVKRIASLIKPGGTLLLHSTVRNKEGQGYYHVGKTKYVQVALPLQFVLTTLKENGFADIEKNVFSNKECISTYNNASSDLETTVFITATKT